MHIPQLKSLVMFNQIAQGLSLSALLFLVGCQSPYHADQGALFGGLTGAGVGAVVGNAVGNPAAGALLGAGVGTVTGAAVGSSLDDIEARNRAQIAAQMGAQVRPGVVSMADVINMSRAGVSEPLIVTHIQHNGMAAPVSASDLIVLKQQGVSDGVIQVMQAVPMQAMPMQPQPVAMAPGPPVIVEEHYYGGPYYGPYYGPRRYHGGPRTSFGFSVMR